MIYKIWEDEKEDEAIEIEAGSIREGLDDGAKKLGYADYVDMAQVLGWDEDDGLHRTFDRAELERLASL